MSKKLKILLVSAISVMCCVALLTVGVMALFTSQEKVNNHLQAGSLDIKLERTALEQTFLNERGFLETVPDNTKVDFSKPNSNRDNIFGLTKDQEIVPGSSFKATLQVSGTEENSVAFSYYLEIKLDTEKLSGIEYQQLAEQLELKVEVGGEVKDTKKLSDGLTVGGEKAPVGTVAIGAQGEFVVTLTFVNIEENEDNNTAMAQNVYFDLIVHAVQATTEA